MLLIYIWEQSVKYFGKTIKVKVSQPVILNTKLQKELQKDLNKDSQQDTQETKTDSLNNK